MANVEVSDADNNRIRDFVVRFLYDYNLADGEGISGTVIQQPYIDQFDRVLTENPDFIKNQKKKFKKVVQCMIDEGQTVDLFENSEGKCVLRLYDSVRPRDIIALSSKENNPHGHTEKIAEPSVQPEGSHRRIDRSLKEGIDPKGLAPKFKKRRITEVEESEASGNDIPLSPSRICSRNSSPQSLARPALALLDGNRRISAPEQCYSPSVQSEPYQMDFFPNPVTKDENLLSLPIWLQRGLSELRQKYPDSQFKATDGNDIKCMDCDTEHKVAKYKKTGNFENHLKSKGHLENVKFRLDNITASRPASALSTVSPMPPPPPPLPLSLPVVPPMAGFPDNSGSSGGLLESMIANAVQQSTGPLTVHIRNLENRLVLSESLHKQKLEEMAKQLDDSETRSRDFYSQLEVCRLSTEAMSARLLAVEAGMGEQRGLSRRLRLLEQANESLQATRSSHAAQLKIAQDNIKLLKQPSIPSMESTIADQSNRLLVLGQQYECTAQDLSRHCELEEERRRKLINRMEEERQKLHERVNLLQTAIASRHGELEEIKSKVSHGHKHDQGKFDTLRSQLTLESQAQFRQFSTSIKAIEKNIIQNSAQFTSLDHRTAEWIDTTDKKHDAKLADLNSMMDQKILAVRANLMSQIDDLKKQRADSEDSVGTGIERRLAPVERMITAMKNQLTSSQTRLATNEGNLSQLVSNVNNQRKYIESLASSWKTWQEEREEELRNLDIELMTNSSAMDKLQTEHTAFLETTPKAIQKMERRLEEQGQSATMELHEKLKSLEASLTEKICSLLETQVKLRQSMLELQHKQSDTLMNKMDEKLRTQGKACAELAQKTQAIQKRTATLMDQKMQERSKGEDQRNKARIESLIRDFVSKRDHELEVKYEGKFKPMLFNYLTEKDQVLRKEYDEKIETSFQARMMEREKDLEIKYEEKFKPLISKFLMDQQMVLRDVYEARIEKLLGGFKDDILSADKENKNPAIKSEEEIKSIVLDLTGERESALLKKHEADIDELIGMHRAEMGLLEEQTIERLLTLEQVIKDQAQQIEDIDCVFPLVLDDLNGLMIKERVRNRGLRRDYVRVRDDGR
ncbi:hypothetical protein EYC80_010349 [Monilinia laxa]|uniref:Uncharacterized protein n=1 Tax=Monilinia laxa TaxID=61186 RepID=A0A5N6JRE1_MONLA|nr:hypothetical protein EYC80_010349 [Monilinia laxa]